METEPIQLPYAQWQDLNQVPPPFRKLRGSRLTLEQINTLQARAHELGAWQELEGVGQFFTPDEGAARLEFMEAHEVQNNQWVVKQ